MKKTKILIVVSYLSGGGAEHVARKNLECLIDCPEYQAGILTCDKESAKKYSVEFCILQDFKRLHGKFSQSAAFLGYQQNYSRTTEFLHYFHPDIIHIHDFIPMTPSVLKAIRRYKAESGCKVILTHHTFSYICTNDSLYNYCEDHLCEVCVGRLDKTIIYKRCSGKLATSCAKYFQKKRFASYWDGLFDLHISPSQFLKQKLLQADPTLPIQVVYNPCIEAVLPVSTQEKTNTIVYFGRISREKNIVRFAELFAETPTKYQLLIIGDGKLSSELEGIVARAPQQKIHFIHKFLSTDVLYQTISSARYFVLPSVWYENSPVSIVEGINSSMIPLVSNIGGMEELVKLFGVGQTFNSKETKQIQTVIQDLDNSNETEGLQSARTQLQNFTVTAYSEKIRDVYLRLMK